MDGTVHTNGLENFWSLLKRSIVGTYTSVGAVPPLPVSGRAGVQVQQPGLTDAERFLGGAGNVIGKRLTYADLTGKGMVA